MGHRQLGNYGLPAIEVQIPIQVYRLKSQSKSESIFPPKRGLNARL
jgi:hypothetical protein